METINPFGSDEFKKQILGENFSETSDDSYEILPPSDDISGFQKIISGAPKIPSQVKNVILDASALAKNDKQARAEEINLSLNNILTKYNKTYGTSLSIDCSNMSRTLVACSDPRSRRTMELFLSEIFQSIRPILILQMISKLALAIDYILDPERMFGGDLGLTDIWVSVEKIMQYIQQLEAMKEGRLIKGADLELKKLGEDSGNGQLDPEKSEALKEFLSLFEKENGLGEQEL